MENLQLKRYTIREKTGEGGMADVFLAYDNVLNRECAIKIMKSELSSDPVARIRFRREADAAATLQHPNIVTIYDVGESNNRPFIVMEYVRGFTLKSLIQQRGAIEKKEAIFIATQICEGLKAAHDAGVIHRDVKPHNILIKADSTAKITDFGIASVAGAIQLTQHDSVMGSVHYLAPECSRGEQASAQSDLYSLGIVLYEMLTGDLPYKGDAAVQVAMKHMQQDIPSVRSLNNSIEQSIENIIIKATSKNKLTRYQNAQEMLDDLRVCLSPQHANDAKVVLSPVLNPAHEETRVFSDITPSTQKKSMSSRDKVLIGVIGAAVLGLLILLFSSLMNQTPVEPETFTLVDLKNMTKEEATNKLTELELTLNPVIEYEISDDIEKDRVIRSNPAANSQVKKGDQVTLYISEGKTFEVEDYTNMTLDEVRNRLQSIDFITIRVEYEDTNSQAPNTVLGQSGLYPGDKIDPTTSHNLILRVAQPAPFQIPDLRGENYLTAKSELEQLGATVALEALDSTTLTDQEWEETDFEVVTRISPTQGSSFTPSDTNQITLTYYTKSDRVIVKTDKTALQQRVTEASQLETSLMTQESVYALNLAIENAQNVLNNDNATQENVENALARLNEAISLLKPIPVMPNTPVVNAVYAGDELVTGQADPGITIRITDSNNAELGIGAVNQDGSFSISIPAQEAGTGLVIRATNNDGLESDAVPVIVAEKTE